MTLTQQIVEYVRACFTGLWVQSHEHTEALRELTALCREQDWQCGIWDIDQGLKIHHQAGPTTLDAPDPLSILKAPFGVGDDCPPSLLVLVNFHRFLNSPEVVQTLYRRIQEGRYKQTVFLILSPIVQLPTELEKLFTILQHELPDREQLARIAEELTSVEEVPSEPGMETVLDAAQGPTRQEAENAYALSLIRHQELNPQAI